MENNVMVVESSVFSKEFEDLHDDGSLDEHRIFNEIFFSSESRNKEFIDSAAITVDGCFMEQTNSPFCSNSGNSSLTSQDDHAKEYFTEKPPLEYLSGDLISSSSKDNCNMALSVRGLSDVKPYLGDTLITSARSKGIASGVSQQDSEPAYCSLTYRVVESSSGGVISSHYQLNQLVDQDKACEISATDRCKNILPSLDQNEQREAVSPISQESHASKALIIVQTVSAANKFEIHMPKKPRWKDHCFVKLDEDKLAMPKNLKNDPRPLLRFHINRLFTAAGWVIGRRRRNNKYNGMGEYVYKSPGGRPFREFHKAWFLCGETLLTEAIDFIPVSSCMQWADITELWNDLSLTVKEIDDKLNTLQNTSAMAHSWCLLDPFANVVFIDKTIRLLKEGITVKSKRSLEMPSDVGSAAKYRKISTSERSCLNPSAPQACGYDHTFNQAGVNLFDVPICSEKEPKLLRDPETVFPNQGSSTSSPSFDPEAFGEDGFGHTMKARKKSRKISQMKLTGDTLGETAHHSLCEMSSAKSKTKKSKVCSLSDDDLLISAIIKSKTGRSTTKWFSSKSKHLRKRKIPKGSCRLLPRSLNKGAKQIMEGKWSLLGSRTVLSWLIHSGVVSLNEVIQYRNLKDDSVVNDGLITMNGILCRCCSKILSISSFNKHAGFRLNRPCTNLFMESGKPLTLCLLEAWSAEYKERKIAPRTDHVNGVDQNDDSCGRCGDVGELICCDNCPSAFHQECLFEQELPEGNWYCPQCRCQICGDVVNDKETSQLHGSLKCSQCDHKYHETCMQAKGIEIGFASDAWFCGDRCNKVYSGLQSTIGLRNLICDDFSWTLLRCLPGDQKTHSAQRLVALKAECNSKLAVAITIMEECFLPMVDIKTGIDMIPQVIYNWGSLFARLNYSAFYTVVLEKDDVILSVASIRIHGVAVAELPLIATCSKNRRQGMCRRLINSIEEMLVALKVEQLVVSAIPSLVETWTVGFGFKPLEEDERRNLSKINLMVFPGAVWLKKSLYDNRAVEGTIDYTVTQAYEGGDRTTKQEPLTKVNPSVQKGYDDTGPCHTDSNILKCSNEQDNAILQNQPSKLCFKDQEPDLPVEDTTIMIENINIESENVPFNEEKSGDVLLDYDGKE